LSLWGCTAASSAEDSLASWIPADIGLSVHVRAAGARVEEFSHGEMFRRMSEFPPVKRWRSEVAPELDRLSDQVERELGLSAGDLWSKVLAQQVLLAVWPPAAPGQEADAVLLVESSDVAALGRLWQGLQAALARGGIRPAMQTIAIGEAEHAMYAIPRAEAAGHVWFSRIARTALIANRREALERVLLCQADSGNEAPPSLAELPAYQDAHERISPQAVVEVFVNPRPWDATWEAAETSGEVRSPSARQTWQAVRYVCAGIELAPSLAVEGFVEWDAALVPAAVRESIASLSGASTFLDRVPHDAVAAATLRIDLSRLLVLAARRFADGEEKPPPPWTSLLALSGAVGPDWGFIVTRTVPAPPGTSSGLWRTVGIDWLVGTGTGGDGSSERQAIVTTAVDGMLRSVLMFAAAAANLGSSEQTAKVTSTVTDGVVLTTISGLGPVPGGAEVTYTVLPDFVWIGSSQEGVIRAATQSPDESLAHSEVFRARTSPRVSEPNQLLYVDLAAVRGILLELPGPGALRGDLVPGTEDSNRGWEELAAILSLADYLVVEARFEETGVAAACRIGVVEP
jgi:hypothetical protein